MIADGKICGGKLRVGGNVVRLKADDAAELLNGPTVITGLSQRQPQSIPIVGLIRTQLYRHPVFLDGMETKSSIARRAAARLMWISRVPGTQPGRGSIFVDPPGKISRLGQRRGQAGMGVGVVGIQFEWPGGIPLPRPERRRIAEAHWPGPRERHIARR